MGIKGTDTDERSIFCWLEEKSAFHEEINSINGWGPGFDCPHRLHNKRAGMEKTRVNRSQIYRI